MRQQREKESECVPVTSFTSVLMSFQFLYLPKFYGQVKLLQKDQFDLFFFKVIDNSHLPCFGGKRKKKQVKAKLEVSAHIKHAQ